MKRPEHSPLNTAFTTLQLAERLECQLEGSGDVVINSITTIEEAVADQLTFLANPRYRRFLPQCHAGAIIIDPMTETPPNIVRLVSKQPYQTFCNALEILYPPREPDIPIGIHPYAAVDPTVELGDGVRIGAFVEVCAGVKIGRGTVLYSGSYIGRNSVIGDDSVIGVGAVIQHEVTIGNRVVIGDRSVIGFDGFGNVPTASGFIKIPQVGTVEIADDVEIGAGCCVDRAAVGVTRIGKGSKLDNLIQIAHGVQIGEHTAIAAQTGISGSTRIGSGVLMGGQAGLAGHIEIGDRMIVGAQAGVTKSFDINGMISGYPARPQMKAMRIEAAMNKLPDLLKRVRALEKILENSGGDQ